jgi:hypothetical protein
MEWEKDVFCAACGEKIDTFSNNTGKDDGFSEALIIGESRAIHKKETGCPGIDDRGNAWNFGPWRKVVSSQEETTEGKG